MEPMGTADGSGWMAIGKMGRGKMGIGKRRLGQAEIGKAEIGKEIGRIGMEAPAAVNKGMFVGFGFALPRGPTRVQPHPTVSNDDAAS